MNEYELYLSFAAFVFFAKKKIGFEFQKHGDFLSFNYSGGKYYFCQIMPPGKNSDCGYVVVNIHDFELLFENDDEYIGDLKSCERPKLRRSDGSIEHCRLDKSLWGNIKTEISPGKFINCSRT